MKKIIMVLCLCSLAVCLAGCGKKHEALEDMQQPMAPEDLSRLTSQTQNAAVENLVAPSVEITGKAGQDSTTSQLDPLPPPGPYKPTSLEIQTALKNAGFYTGAIDGKIGPLSKKAIEEFQKANNLVVDGKVGPKTWNLLSKYLKPQTAAPKTTTKRR